ncbi:MAG: hypothetical protein GVY16_08435 [Planctomycetes bacterium]|jgi:hypothetical protein|nr:hypothetical protein [Phycisphaerae bacterium]NBB95753.1 hypothetical protein [Planctomycetota bacterium]
MAESQPEKRHNEYAEAELERLKGELLDRIDEAERPPATAGGDGKSLADQCHETSQPLDEDESFGFDLAEHLKDQS